MILKYNGSGEHIIGVPAQDLTQADVERIANEWQVSKPECMRLLTARGLYSEPQKKKPKTKSSTDKEL